MTPTEIQELKQAAIAASAKKHGKAWTRSEGYKEWVTCPAGIICEVRGVGQGMMEPMSDYLVKLEPAKILELIQQLELLSRALISSGSAQ